MKLLIPINCVAFSAFFLIAAYAFGSLERRLSEEQQSRVTLELRVLKMEAMLKRSGYDFDKEFWR